jgi:CRISPR-associated endonuclease/helicase Cas3
MSNYSIKLKPVYSQTVATPEGLKLPNGWLLSWHQAATLEALRDRNIDVVFNTAMTGDGKSLAAYLEVLQGQFCAIALYPTNELARDQEIQVREYIEKFNPEDKLRVVRLSGTDLEIYAENEGLKKGAAIATLTNQREALLTNPDIFHYLHRGAYIIRGDSPDKLWGRIDKDFDLFIFDEFHVFAAPQIAGVINTMLLIRCTNRRKKFLFLSATPHSNLISKLETAGFRCQVINPIEEQKYQFPDTPQQEEKVKIQGWRQVLRSISLDFIPLEPSFKASEV